MTKATERLFFNEDKTRLVSEGSPEARFLAAGVGDEIPKGFTVEGGQDEHVPEPEPEVPVAPGPEPEPDEADAKQAPKAADKAVKHAGNKSAGA